MGIFDRNGDGKTTIGEAAYTLEQIEEYEKAWDEIPEKDDPMTCGLFASGCIGCLAAPFVLVALFYLISLPFSG